MIQSASLLFPFRYDNENDCMKRATTIEETLLAAMRVFLITRRGSRLGNNVGSFLPELLLTAVSKKTLYALSDELKQELQQQFVGVQFLEVLLTPEVINNTSVLKVSIKFSGNTGAVIDLTLDIPSIFSDN